MVSEHIRLDQALRANKDLKLVAYMMGGHPNRKRSIEVGKRLATSGIAALEIGIPHSDPLADGPVIQHAGQIALEHGMTVAGCLEIAAAVASEGTPVVLMSYINPILAYDPRKFAAEAAQHRGGTVRGGGQRRYPFDSGDLHRSFSAARRSYEGHGPGDRCA